jgi:hypothetical protein
LIPQQYTQISSHRQKFELKVNFKADRITPNGQPVPVGIKKIQPAPHILQADAASPVFSSLRRDLLPFFNRDAIGHPQIQPTLT